jgi:hypothetical protein
MYSVDKTISKYRNKSQYANELSVFRCPFSAISN